MDNIQFDGENSDTKSGFVPRSALRAPRMLQALIKLGIVKNEKQASFVLFALSLLFFSLAIYIFYFFVFSRNLPKRLSAVEEQQRKEHIDMLRAGLSPLPIGK